MMRGVTTMIQKRVGVATARSSSSYGGRCCGNGRTAQPLPHVHHYGMSSDHNNSNDRTRLNDIIRFKAVSFHHRRRSLSSTATTSPPMTIAASHDADHPSSGSSSGMEKPVVSHTDQTMVPQVPLSPGPKEDATDDVIAPRNRTTTHNAANFMNHHHDILQLLEMKGTFGEQEYTRARDFFYSFTTPTDHASSNSSTGSCSNMENSRSEDRIATGLQLYERLLQEIQYQGSITTLQEQEKKWICDLYQTIIPLLKEWKSTSSVEVLNDRETNGITRRPPFAGNVTPSIGVSASTIIQTLQRCEGRYLLQSPPPPQQENQHTLSVNSNILESYYFWCNPILVPLLLEMLLRQSDSTPIQAEKFIHYVQKRQRQLQLTTRVVLPSPEYDMVSQRPTTTDHDPPRESDVEIKSTTTHSSTAIVERLPPIEYQFPNETMCRQLLHAWVSWGCRSTTATGARERMPQIKKNGIAIRQVETLISKMTNLYHISPSIHYYNGLLKLHAQSPSPTLATMIPSITTTPMNLKHVFDDQPTTQHQQNQRRVTRRFGWDPRDKIEIVIRAIEQSSGKVLPTLETWYQTVFCYCNWNCFMDAQDVILNKMIPMVNVPAPSVTYTIKDNEDAHDNMDTTTNLQSTKRYERQSTTLPLLDMACHLVVAGYRRLICVSSGNRSSLTPTKYQKRVLLQHLTTFMESLQQIPPNTISQYGLEQIYGTLMDIYRSEGNITQLEELIKKMDSPNVVFYSLLVKAYGIAGCPDRGEEVLRGILLNENVRVRPTIDVVNVLINAWAINATIPDAPDRALSIIRLMDHNVSCIQLGIQPDTVSFNTYLKCLSTASAHRLHETSSNASSIDASSRSSQYQPGESNMGRYVENILKEMEERFRAGNRSVLPNAITYNTAIKCCANVGDKESALSILNRMKSYSGISPNIRTYNTVLAMYAKIGTSDSAKMAEEHVMMMQQLSKTNPSIKPDTFSFSHLCQAWTKSGDAELHDRICMIYERMRSKEYDVQPDMIMYTFLVSTLSCSPNMRHLEYATTLLNDMERDNLRPDSRHFMPIINAYLHRIKGSNASATNDLSGDGEKSIGASNVETAAKLFLRFLQSDIRRRTTDIYDAPKEETMHAIVKGYIQTKKILDGKAFLARIELLTKKKHYLYQELEAASLAATE